MRRRKRIAAKAATKEVYGLLRNQKVEFVDARTLLEKRHPLNPKTHSKRQRNAFNALKGQVGWAGVALLNELTGKLLNGHMRVEEAASKGEEVPLVRGRWTKEQEKLILADLDPIGFLAGTDAQAMKSLHAANTRTLNELEKIGHKDKERLAQLNQDLHDLAESDDAAKPLLKQAKKRVRIPLDRSSRNGNDDGTAAVPGNFDGSIYDEPEARNDIIFESDLPYGLPPLLPDLIATPDLLPNDTWSRSVKHDGDLSRLYYCHSSAPFPPEKDGGVLGFFTEDWRFEEVYKYADDYLEELKEEDWTAIVAPEFSTYHDWPLALRIYNVYRSRWCARYWQEAGFYVIPCIQDLGGKGPVSCRADPSIETLRGSRTIAIQAKSNRGDKQSQWERTVRTMVSTIETIKPHGVLIYGGENRKKFEGFLPPRVGKSKIEYSIIDSYTSLRTRSIARKKKG